MSRGGGYYTKNYSLINIGRAEAKANMALAQLADIRGSLNVEYKRFDLDASLNPSSTGAIQHLTNIAQGDGDQNRDGLQCKLKSVYTKWYIKQHASATKTLVRCIWFIDNSQDGTAPTVAEVLESATVLSHKNFVQRKRFTFLKDLCINLGDNTVANGEYYKKLNMVVNYTDTTGSDTVDNHLYFLHISTEPTDTPTMLVKHRVRFLDN